LLQRWYSTTGARSAGDPYFLYAASNLGSLIGLLAYPFVLEPRLRLGEQSALWSTGYALLFALTAACAWAGGRGRAAAESAVEAVTLESGEVEMEAGEESSAAVGSVPWSRRLRWALLALAPSSLMLGVTQYLTTEVASVPLLWVLPLAIYLLSFVIVFSRRSPIPRSWIVRLHPYAVLVAMLAVLYRPEHPLVLVLALHLLVLLVMAIGCHGALARERPAVEHLTQFYLWLAVGGALGGIFNALIAPLLFSSVTEYPLAIALAGALSPTLTPAPEGRRDRILDLTFPVVLAALCWGVVQLTRTMSEFRQLADTRLIPALLMVTLPPFARRPLRFGLAILALWGVGHVETGQGAVTVFRARSFFGIHRVTDAPGTHMHTLFHGTIVHGLQSTDPARRHQPLGYYHLHSPLARIFETLDRRQPTLRVGAVGLGAGAVAAYGRAGEPWTFYEIDPIVVHLANDPRYFTYLADSKAQIHTVLGDARLQLQADTTAIYDLLILDAYSSDAVPVHLITREAVELYLRRLAPHGVMAFHISSRHFRLAPVLSVLADQLHLVTLIRSDPLDDVDIQRGILGSTYVAMARQESDFGEMATDSLWKPLIKRPGMRPWTDDYSSVFTVLVWR